MVNNKKQYTIEDKIVYAVHMRRNNINKYNVIGKVRKVVGVSLLAYGVATGWLPSGSQLAVLGGCALLGIPMKKVMAMVKHWGKKAWFIVRVLVSPKRLKYEIKLWSMRK